MPTSFEVFNRMIESDDKAMKMAPLSNIDQARATEAGTKITIGVAGNVVGQILNSQFVGGLILCDRKRFEEVKAEMERAVGTTQRDPEPERGPGVGQVPKRD